MIKVAKIKKLIPLFDIYKNLLTPIQIETFEFYYFNDLSLQEIANRRDTSKQSVLDSLKSIEINLFSFEDKLRIHEKYLLIEKYLNKLKKDFKNNSDLVENLDQIKTKIIK